MVGAEEELMWRAARSLRAQRSELPARNQIQWPQAVGAPALPSL